VDYSPFIVHRDDVEDIGEGVNPSNDGSGGVPPPIFTASASIFVFWFFCGDPLEETLGSYI
jgi:hypothetical protein